MVDDLQNEKLLKTNLKKWETFRIDGVIEYNHGQLSFRKNISLRKLDKVARLDIYDTGIFGLRPTPFISAYYDSVMYLRSQDHPTLVKILPQDHTEAFSYLELLLEIPELDTHSSEIIASHKITKSGTVDFIFDKNMTVKKIVEKSEAYNVLFHYDVDLSEIEVFRKSVKVMNIKVDKIVFDLSEIKKLS
jgi:hypothetical protein